MGKRSESEMTVPCRLHRVRGWRGWLAPSLAQYHVDVVDQTIAQRQADIGQQAGQGPDQRGGPRQS